MKNLIFATLILLAGSLMTAQTYNVSKNRVVGSINAMEYVRLNKVQRAIQPTNNVDSNRANTVLINQVGTGNISELILNSSQSEVNVMQIGNNNKALLSINAQTIKQKLIQIGTDNLYRDTSLHHAKLHSGIMVQEGSYNEILRTGSNSISERINVTQKGIGRKAFITHF